MRSAKFSRNFRLFRTEYTEVQKTYEFRVDRVDTLILILGDCGDYFDRKFCMLVTVMDLWHALF
jgi:hypothetical protein